MQNIIIPHNGFVVCCWEYEVLKSVPLFSAQDMRYLGFFECSEKQGVLARVAFYYSVLEFKKKQTKTTNDTLSCKIHGL